MAFPDVTTLLDDFNRTNGSVEVGGPAWVHIGGGTPQMSVESNTLRAKAASENAVLPTTYGPDLDSTVDIGVGIDNGSYYAYWFCLGPNTGSFNAYALILIRTSTTATWQLRRYASGGLASTMVSTTGLALPAAGDSIGVSKRGTTLTAYHKPSAGSWTSMVSTTDSTLSTGLIGFELGDTNARLDNLKGGTYTSGVSGTVSLSGGGTLTATGSKAASGTAQVHGGGTIVSTPGGEVHAGPGVLTGGGLITSVGAKAASSPATIHGGGTLASSNSPTKQGSTSCTGGGTIVAGGGKQANGTASLSGGGLLRSNESGGAPPQTPVGRRLLVVSRRRDTHVWDS